MDSNHYSSNFGDFNAYHEQQLYMPHPSTMFANTRRIQQNFEPHNIHDMAGCSSYINGNLPRSSNCITYPGFYQRGKHTYRAPVKTRPSKVLPVQQTKDIENKGPGVKKASQETSSQKRSLPLDDDSNLPVEIAEKMTLHQCKLCFVKLNSKVQSKSHYEGKLHAKKVKAAIETLKECKNGLSESPAKKKKLSAMDSEQLYCKCCSLSFTSPEHAKQHYFGRNHQRVLHGLVPLKPGYFNKKTGKWQRMPPDPTVSAELLKVNSDKVETDYVKDKAKFFCELCGVAATSQEQLNGHLKGARHKKSLEPMKNTNTQQVPKVTDTILASIINEDTRKCKDLSVYRTPSGNYYCASCNTTLNSENQFNSHLESRRHQTGRK